MKADSDITALLRRCEKGDKVAFHALFPLVYDQLKAIARRQLGGHVPRSLNPTALVHEVFLRLEDSEKLIAESRAHFFSIVAQCMRWLIADYARKRHAGKRGAGGLHVTFNEASHPGKTSDMEIHSLNLALEKLARIDADLSRIVDLHYLVGLSIEETARVVQLSIATVKRRCVTARAWLAVELEKQKAA